MKLFTAILGLLSGLIQFWRESKVREQGRREQAEAAREMVDERIAQAEMVDGAIDERRNERLRTRFDRAARSE